MNRIKESIDILNKDMKLIATPSTSDVKSIIENSDGLLRIVYFFLSGFYYICRDSYHYSHSDILKYLYDNLIEDQSLFDYDKSTGYIDSGYCLAITSTPLDEVNTNLSGEKFNIITEDGYTYGYEYAGHLVLTRWFGTEENIRECPLFYNQELHNYEEEQYLDENFKDEVSENTLKKRRDYYLKHGVKNVFPSGLLESPSLDITTPYMLRNDGELLTCGDIHPYIKSYRKESLEETLKYLDLHKSFLDWFYDNSLNKETKTLIQNFDRTKETIERLWYLTNQEFCRVRTSNYRYKIGGDNGEIYFRISSENFNWFDLIWNTCIKYSPSIDYITIMKDPQTFGKQFDYIEIKGSKINKFPIKDFIELEGEPLIENKHLKIKKISELSQEINENFSKRLHNTQYEGLEEDIEKHDTLNPLLFDENDELKPDIKEAIIKIVNQFIEDLSAGGVKFSLKDIILVGSNVSYNYTKDSDLDIHIIVDSESIDCNPEVYILLYGAYRSLFNKNYEINIKGIPVEIYVELA